MNQLPVVAIADDSSMFAADSLERLIEPDLTGSVASQFNLVDNDFLRLTCCVILGTGLVFQDVIGTSRALKIAPTPAPTEPATVRL